MLPSCRQPAQLASALVKALLLLPLAGQLPLQPPGPAPLLLQAGLAPLLLPAPPLMQALLLPALPLMQAQQLPAPPLEPQLLPVVLLQAVLVLAPTLALPLLLPQARLPQSLQAALRSSARLARPGAQLPMPVPPGQPAPLPLAMPLLRQVLRQLAAAALLPPQAPGVHLPQEQHGARVTCGAWGARLSGCEPCHLLLREPAWQQQQELRCARCPHCRCCRGAAAGGHVAMVAAVGQLAARSAAAEQQPSAGWGPVAQLAPPLGMLRLAAALRAQQRAWQQQRVQQGLLLPSCWSGLRVAVQ